MIEVVYYNKDLRCYRDGRIERSNVRRKIPKWFLVENTANDKDGYNQVKIEGKMIFRHRLIAFFFGGLEDIVGRKNQTNIIDHIDGDKLNNSAANLRVCNAGINAHNRKEVKGCTFHKSSGKWRSEIMVNKKHIHLGYFLTEAEARAAYLAAKRKYDF